MTPEQIEEFKNQPDIVLVDVNSASSYKTNFLTIKNNFNKIAIYLKKMHVFVVYLYSLIDTNKITQDVLENLQSTKKFVLIDVSMVENQVYNQNGYSITRLENNVILIKRQQNPETWNVDNLLVTIKDVDGTFVYPVITTKDAELKIVFVDGIGSNYRVILL